MSNTCQLGAQMYTLREYCKDLKGIAESCRKVAAIGYKAIQISGFGPADAKDVAKAIADAGLVAPSSHLNWPQVMNETDAVIEDHRIWNCRHAAIGILPGEYYADASGMDRFLSELPPVAKRLTDAGLTFSYHNHNGEFARVGGKIWLETLYAKADPKHLKAELDTYWIAAGGCDPAAWVRKYAGRQPLLHLKDYCVTLDKREVRFAPIGEGNLDWPAILQAAKQAGVEWYFVEQDNCYGRDPFECLASSYRFLTSMGLK